MRIKFREKIYTCICATLDGDKIFLAIGDSVYMVSMNTIGEANAAHKTLLERGWYDFSNYN